MDSQYSALLDRVTRLERRLRRAQQIAAGSIAAAGLLGVVAWSTNGQAAETIRTRQLIVQDAAGHDRVVIGAPIPDPVTGKRHSSGVGIAINDPTGFERFAVALGDDDNMNMGFDAPRRGTVSNPERISLIANATGGAELRFLNQSADVVTHLTLFNDGTAALFFVGHESDRIMTHRVSASGDTTVVSRR
jgi:hypothetical protein